MLEPDAEVLDAFGAAGAAVEPLGGGHVHRTYAVRPARGAPLVLQAVNPAVIGDAWRLAERTVELTETLARHPDPLLDDRRALRTRNREPAFRGADATVWRAFELIDRAVAAHRAEPPTDPALVARLFGRFDRRLADAGIPSFGPTPFHDLRRRIAEFQAAVADPVRPLPADLLADLAAFTERAGRPPSDLLRRPVHNDAKPANLLVDARTGAAVAVIDLDLVDHGTILDDLGDLLRSQAFVDERLDLDRVGGIVEGYLLGLEPLLDRREAAALARAGELITAELALRRASDHLGAAGYFADADVDENLAQVRRQLLRATAFADHRPVIGPMVAAVAEPYLGPTTG